MRVLLVEDYAPLREATQAGLEDQGFVVDTADSGDQGLTLAMTGDYEAIVLDVMLPGVDGFQILRTLRQRGVSTPVIVITARDAVEDRVSGLDLGADDYLPKPFAMEELYARLRALIRRRHDKAPVVEIGHLTIDTASHRVTVLGEEVQLSAKEYSLLEYLAHRQGELCSREEIRNHLYQDADETQSNVIDVFLSHLRKRIEREGQAKLLHTRRGQGFILGELS